MTDKKFTDEEIIRNYEWCIGCTSDRCRECTMDEEGLCEEELQDLVLDLINRQKVEIENLKREAKVKEFADRIRQVIVLNNTHDGYLVHDIDYNCLTEDIDDVLKELVGESK